MKKILSLASVALILLINFSACAQQDKSKRPSPPVKVEQTLSSGAAISIDYSQIALKGRTVGKDVEPMDGQVWRTGANEATVFETSKDVKIEGQSLPAGKYAFFTIANGDEWTLIFNKTWKTWGAFDYPKNKGEDALNVKVKAGKSATVADKLTYTIDKSGKVSLMWGNLLVNFNVQ